MDAHVRPFSAHATLLDFEYNELTAEPKYKVTTTANVHKQCNPSYKHFNCIFLDNDQRSSISSSSNKENTSIVYSQYFTRFSSQ